MNEMAYHRFVHRQCCKTHAIEQHSFLAQQRAVHQQDQGSRADFQMAGQTFGQLPAADVAAAVAMTKMAVQICEPIFAQEDLFQQRPDLASAEKPKPRDVRPAAAGEASCVDAAASQRGSGTSRRPNTAEGRGRNGLLIDQAQPQSQKSGNFDQLASR